MSKVVVIDYNMGNTDSVMRAIEECGGNPVLSNKLDDIRDATHIILPGVGAFRNGIENLKTLGILSELESQVFDHKIPFLGICLGMQLLAKTGTEFGNVEGMSWIDGKVIKLIQSEKNERIPHMGWNEVHFRQDSLLFEGIESGKDFYFVHSFHFHCQNNENILATTPYCGSFCSVVGKDNILGTQFHPEKSQKLGFAVLRNFLSI